MTLQIAGQPAPNLLVRDTSLSAEFSTFSLSLRRDQGCWEVTTSPSDVPVRIEIDLPGWWYGHGELIHQLFPLNRVMLQNAPFHTFDNSPTGLGSKLNPAWFSSSGTLIIADSPVEVGINQPPPGYPRHPWSFSVEERGPFSERPFLDPDRRGDGRITITGLELNLKLFFTENVLTAYARQVGYFGHPVELPPQDLFVRPTWTTWARYKSTIDEEVVLGFAEEILAHRYPRHLFGIDDRWQICYGDLEFDPQRFPDPRGMIRRLHSLGFKVSLWVMPFMSPESAAYDHGARKGWLVRHPDGSPCLVPWWQGRGGLLDVTHPDALDWFLGRLRELQDRTGCDGFKFDAGEACFLPRDAVTFRKIHPNEYTRLYVEAVAAGTPLAEVRSGWRNQRAPVFFRLWDKSTSWGRDNGLHSVLTGALSMGLAGYPFLLPDLIGGNAYEAGADAELMIRWTQLNALMPSMQFSLPPWEYGSECDEICRRYANLHVELSVEILRAARTAIRSGQPIIRPLFWLDPQDERALTCDDEFLLGDEILAAPVIQPGAQARTIFLPEGKWQEYWTGAMFSGPVVLQDHPAPLDVLPLFRRMA